MGYLEKEMILHRRGEDGNFLPIDFFIEGLDQTVAILPMVQGRLFELSYKIASIEKENEKTPKLIKDLKAEVYKKLIVELFVKPKFTIEELDDLKMVFKDGQIVDVIDTFISGIYAVSGINTADPDEIKKK